MTAIVNHPHRVTTAIAEARSSIGSVAEVPVWSMDPTETTNALCEVTRAEAQLAELEARLLCHADRIEIAADSAASSTANRHAHTTRTTRPAAHRLIRTAQGLEAHAPTRTALAGGEVHPEQAEVILHALDQLPTDLDPEVAGQAEAQLLDLAQQHDAKALRVLGRRILEVVSPETAEAHEAALLEREERAAAAATRITAYQDGHGKVHGRFTTDALTWAIWKKALMAIAAPRHQASKTPLGERRPNPERMGQALTEYVRRYPAKKLPRAGGLNATAVILIPLATLLGGLKAAHLDTGEPLPPPWPDSSPARPGSSPPSSTATPRSSTSAGPDGSTPNPNGSPRPSRPAAAK